MFRGIALLLCLWLPASSWAAGSLDHAFRAQSLLGPGIWSRVIEVRNVSETDPYPKTVYALIFELGDLLWFYTDTNGTQSFSLHVGDLAAEKADFLPLLRDIDPGFAAYTVVTDAVFPPRSSASDLPNGCLIESFAALRERLDHGEPISKARLLTYYSVVGRKRVGHTVLLYETPAGTFQIDPSVAGGPRQVLVTGKGERELLAGDALLLARALNPELVIAKARWVPTTMPRSNASPTDLATVQSGAFVRRGMATTMP